MPDPIYDALDKPGEDEPGLNFIDYGGKYQRREQQDDEPQEAVELEVA